MLKELRDALVLLGLGALHDPERGAADDRAALRVAGEPRRNPVPHANLPSAARVRLPM